MRNKLIAVLALLPLWPLAAQAHVSLVENSAKAGSEFVAIFRVGHGCGGSPTIALSITLPSGVTARPQAKPGWTIAQQRDPAAIIWRGGVLAADQFDDFAVLLHLPAAPGRLIFPVTQSCAAGVEHWSDAPAPGKPPAHPAPVLTLTPGTPGAPAMDAMPGMTMP
jgi:uncharacterized protein YcnI